MQAGIHWPLPHTGKGAQPVLNARSVVARNSLSFLGRRQSQQRRLRAKCHLSLARRRLFLTRTIAQFEPHFQDTLQESEREYLADLLKVQRLTRNKGPVQDASWCGLRAQNSEILAQGYAPIKKQVQNDPKSKAAEKDDGDSIGYRREAAKDKNNGEAEEIKEEETDREIRWLEAKWKSLAEILRQMDPEFHWNDAYQVAMIKSDFPSSRLNYLDRTVQPRPRRLQS